MKVNDQAVELATKAKVKEYSVEIDGMSKGKWNDIIRQFDDAVLYQTWAYGDVRWKSKSLSHCVLKRNDEIVAACQLCIRRVPLISAGIAYAPWGPMWIRKGGQHEKEVCLHMIKAMRKEYVEKRKLVLRVQPQDWGEHKSVVEDALRMEGCHQNTLYAPYTTIIMPLEVDCENLRKGLHRSWRRMLKKAEENGVTADVDSSMDSYDAFEKLYEEMWRRKKFVEHTDIAQFRRIQEGLPPDLKMKIILCKHQNKPVSASVVSSIGQRGISIFLATGNQGLNIHSSYVAAWKEILHMKAAECRFIDKGGIDLNENPDVGRFKKGVGGYEIQHLGQFECCDNAISAYGIRILDFIRTTSKRVRDSVCKIQQKVNQLKRRRECCQHKIQT